MEIIDYLAQKGVVLFELLAQLGYHLYYLLKLFIGEQLPEILRDLQQVLSR